MDVRIRDVRVEDAEAIVGILNPIIEAGRFTALDTPLTADNERAFILGFPSRGIFHVAEDRQRQRVVGLQTMEPFAAYTHAFDHVGVIATFVDLNRRRQGIGKLLFEATFAAARRQGYEKLFTYVRADNHVALEAYDKQGFSVVGTARKHAKCGNQYVDEVIIERFL
jgi:L-amino acid N-acyltransferase YncA